MSKRCLQLLGFSFLAFSTSTLAQNLPTSLIETIAGAEPASVLGSQFSFGAVAGLTADAAGNIYFSLQPLSRVYRLGADGQVTVFAGSGVRGKHRNGIAAVASPLLNPYSLATDAAGNLFIAAWHSLLRVDAGTGVLSTVFTTPYRPSGSSSNCILGIEGMTIGADGVLYLSDGVDWRIKRYSFTTGAVSVLAGNGTLGPTRPGVPATATPLKYPQSIAIGTDGTVYFSTLEPAVFHIRRDGKLEVLNIRLNASAPALGEYDIPSHIALDHLGYLFITQANRSRILRVALKSGNVSIYAGTGSQRFNGDGIKATQASISMPSYIVSDSAGNLTVAEESRIRRIDSSTKLVTTIVGNGLPMTEDATAPATHAKLWEPAYAVPAPDGTVYITSSFSHRLLRLGPDGTLTTVAGDGDPVRGEVPGTASEVALNYPQGIWVDDTGEVYFSDHDNRVVRRLTQTGSVDNFATTPKNTNSAGLFLYYSAALVADAEYFYLADPNGNQVWRISRRDGSVEPYIGTGTGMEGQSPDNGNAKPAKLISPSGLALDSSGRLYISEGSLDGKKGRILRLDTDGQMVTILSDLQQPSGLAFQSPTVLCFSETGASVVRCLDLPNHSTRVVAGTGLAGLSGDGGPAECAQLNRPSGISFDHMGNLYIADTGNQRIRRVRLSKRPFDAGIIRIGQTPSSDCQNPAQ